MGGVGDSVGGRLEDPLNIVDSVDQTKNVINGNADNSKYFVYSTYDAGSEYAPSEPVGSNIPGSTPVASADSTPFDPLAPSYYENSINNEPCATSAPLGELKRMKSIVGTFGYMVSESIYDIYYIYCIF